MSKIEWTDKTWNPVTGCTKVSQGCKNCYAERMYERFHGKDSFRNVISHADRLIQPLKWRKPAMVFVNSMSDLFHEDVPFEFIDRVFVIMKAARQHVFQILTKRPERMLEYFSSDRPQILDDACMSMMEDGSYDIGSMVCYVQAEGVGPFQYPASNIWIGVSVEDQKTADERIPLLLKVPAAVRFLSCEPLLGPIDFYKVSDAMPPDRNHPWRNGPILQGIHWIICGGESGPGARPMHPDWARSLREQCRHPDVKVPFFFKQWGNWMPINKPWEDNAAYKPLASNERYLNLAGGHGFHGEDVYRVRNVGKKKAGRLLDGQLHDLFPKKEEIKPSFLGV